MRIRTIRMIGPAVLFLAGAAGLLGGCGTWRGGPASQPAELSLELKLDKADYRPGEAVLATVTLKNETGRAQAVQELDAESVRFYLGRQQGEDIPMERKAIHSPGEPFHVLKPLAPGGSWERSFVLTRLTGIKGPLKAQAHYQPSRPGDKNRMARIYSNNVNYQVAGDVLFKRDGDGLVLASEAIKLARAQEKGPVTDAGAILITDEAGFARWWVNVTVEGQPKPVGYYVNPYIGKVSFRAEPFSPEQAKDRRIKQPASRPAIKRPKSRR